MKKDLHVAIAGATGAVGIEMLKTLEKRNFPVGKLTPLASKRSAGKSLSFRGEEVTVQELTKDSFAGVDIALFSAGGGDIRGVCTSSSGCRSRGCGQLKRISHG